MFANIQSSYLVSRIHGFCHSSSFVGRFYKKKDVSIINCLVNSLRNFNIRKRSVCEYQSKLLNSPRVNVSILVNSQMGGPFFESMWDKKDAIEQVTEHITMECFEILRTCQNAWLQGVNEDT